MKIIGLDGEEYNWNIYSHVNRSGNFSSLHISARELIKNIFPYDIICEDISLPGTKNHKSHKPLMADFFVVNQRIIIEVNGQQHEKYTPFMHQNKMGFLQSKRRDREKQEWAKINGIEFISLEHSESTDEWRRKIERR